VKRLCGIKTELSVEESTEMVSGWLKLQNSTTNYALNTSYMLLEEAITAMDKVMIRHTFASEASNGKQ
jgi:hypothetical protein